MRRRADEPLPRAGGFATRVSQILEASPVNKGEWGILVVDAATGETLYEKNADSYFVPASNMKLLTTALALDTLGPDYRFRTTIETNGELEEGTVQGDLILVGRGDPNLSNRKFPYDTREEFDGPPERVLSELADQLVPKGVRANFRRRGGRRQLFSARTLSRRMGNRRHGLGIRSSDFRDRGERQHGHTDRCTGREGWRSGRRPRSNQPRRIHGAE